MKLIAPHRHIKTGLQRQRGYISPAVLSAIGGRRRSGTTGGGGGGGGGDTDPYFANVVSLIHGDDIGSPQVVTDVKGRIWTLGGSAQCSSDQSKFGGLSVKFNGSTSYITANDSADFAFGTGDFTVEFWIRWNAVGNDNIMGQSDNVGTTSTRSIDIYVTATSKLEARCWNGTSQIGVCTSASNMTTGAWHHVAYQRESSAFSLFLDGSLIASASSASGVNDSSNKFSIGRLGEVADGAFYFNGWMDDIRITKGVARYVGSPTNFTPPSAAFPDS